MNLRDAFLAFQVASNWNLGHFVDVGYRLFAIHFFDLLFAQADPALACKSAPINLTFVTDSHGVKFATGDLFEIHFAMNRHRNGHTRNPQFGVQDKALGDFHFLVVVQSLGTIPEFILAQVPFLNLDNGGDRLSQLAVHTHTPGEQLSVLFDAHAVSQTVAHGNPVGSNVLSDAFLLI